MQQSTEFENLKVKITEKEIEHVSKLEPFERYRYLIKRVADSELMFSLKKEDQWAIAQVDDCKLFSIWSSKEFALLNATDLWNGYSPVEIDFDMFEDEIMPFLKENNYLMNTFSMSGKSGFVVEVDEFIRDLKEELRNYE